MTNPDTSTLNGALEQLGITMAANLATKGVPASASDGLTTLAGKILDIEPSVGGLDLTSEMSLSASSNSISLGQSVVLTATLTANYDDETLVNVDLHGYLQGATVSFKNGDTVIDTATTDVNGVASYTYTPSSAGTLSLTAVFSGTDNFSSATSSSVSVVVSAPTVASVALTSDKSVLSYYHSQSATLSATVLDSNSSPVESATVEFFKGSTSLGTASTNSSGIATKSYASTGSGDVSFTAECSSIVSETYSLEDCLYAYLEETSFTSNTTTDTTHKLDNNLSINLPSSFECSFDYKGNITNARAGLIPTANTSNSNYSLIVQISSNDYVGIYRDTGTHGLDSGRLSADNTSYHNCKITRSSNTVTWLLGGTNSASTSINWINSHNPYLFGVWTFNSGTVYVKNLKIKPL